MDPSCSIGKGGGSALVELSILTHSAREWSRDGALSCSSTHTSVFIALAVSQPVMHQASDGARKGDMRLSLCEKA